MYKVIIAYDYELEFDSEKNAYRIKNKFAPICPNCGSLLTGYDTRKRGVIGGDGATYQFLLRRLRCAECQQLHLEIPNAIKPQKHYSAEVIRQAVHDYQNSCPADDSTIRRWKKKK